MSEKNLLQAIAFAAEKHRFQRRRDSAESPYINHTIEVARILSEEGGVDDCNVLIAAVLHDTVEDTDTNLTELEELFGPEVAGWVDEVSDDKTLPKLERKRRQIESAASKSAEAKLIKMADKISNLRDIVEEPPVGWSHERCREYVEWSQAVGVGLRNVNAELEARLDDIIAKGLKVFD